MKCQWAAKVRWGFPALLVCLVLCLGMGAASAPNRTGPPGMRGFGRPTSAEEAATTMAESRVDYRRVDQSLTDREDLDFLLTPALLVQEAVSDGVVLTYPEE